MGTIPNSFNLPHRIQRLADLAYNFWWTWNRDARRLFRDLHPVLWESAYHNPVEFLRRIDPDRIKRIIQDSAYIENYDGVISMFDKYMDPQHPTWYHSEYPDQQEHLIAYFSSEFGLHEALPIYAGGLGVLSGDYLKDASDLGVPLVAVGFLYTQGYFKQRISEDGWQEAIYANLAFSDLPVIPVSDEGGDPLMVTVELAGREVHLQIWRVQVGRTPLFLLDSNTPTNAPGDRSLTARLYTGDLESRISQEIILGVGGVRALRAMDLDPSVWHLNEGHSAFLVLERLREMVIDGSSFTEARKRVAAATVFTTHTPVPAGHDEFPLWMIDKYLNQLWPVLGLDRESFIDLAREYRPWGETFSMATLAMRLSDYRNGVSELHGEVSREMWSHLWPDLPASESPIRYITNGVHCSTWLARRMGSLFDHYLETGWLDHVDDPRIWEGIASIPDQELWEVHRHLKRKLAAYMRDRVRPQWTAGRVHPVQVIASGTLLDPYALTIGFARRFATYKRAGLILSQPERLFELLNDPERPVQVIFAGKAHPADEPGKQLIQEVYRQVKRAENGGRLVFLEDYDMNLARYMLQGVDVWLNTPRRPNEASGTSGQKAAMNGVLNFSVLDGWWREGYNGKNGWKIGDDKTYAESVEQDRADAESLYTTLESEIIPLYYDRDENDLPVEWIRWMKESIRSLTPQYCMTRTLKEYIHEMYDPVSQMNLEHT